MSLPAKVNFSAYAGDNFSFTLTFKDKATTTIAAGSDGAVLPQATINVASTTADTFPATGSATIFGAGFDDTTFVYGGKGSTTFTTCTGGSGTLRTGLTVQSTTERFEDLTDWVFSGQVRAHRSDSATIAEFTITNPSTGIVLIELDPLTTTELGLLTLTTLQYDVQRVRDDTVETVIEGFIKMHDEVTRV